jgi:hypothetical protein
VRGLSLREVEAGEAAAQVLLPGGAKAYDFVLAHSRPDDEPELLTGLFVYADTFLQQVRWEGGRGVRVSLLLLPGRAH